MRHRGGTAMHQKGGAEETARGNRDAPEGGD